MINSEKVWFITGCSTGFGRELAVAVIDAGYKVVITARRPEQIVDLATGKEERVLTLKLDVTDENQIKEAVQVTKERFGKIDVLVNNAGIGYFASVEESEENEVRRMFEINFWGLTHVTKAVLPIMRENKAGHIINFSSIGGLTSFPALGYYHATKYAVEGLSESLSKEVEPIGIKVTLIEPASFRTDWGNRSSVKTPITIPEYKETVGKYIPREDMAGMEPGDPKKAAIAILKVVESKNPPKHLLLGKFAYQIVCNKLDELKKEFDEWKETTINADFE